MVITGDHCWGSGQRLRDLLRSGRKIAENRWSSEIRKKEREEQVISRDQEERTQEQVIFRDRGEELRRTGDLPRSERKNPENRWSSEIRTKERGGTGDLPKSAIKNAENKWSSKVTKKKEEKGDFLRSQERRGEQVICWDQE
jgi:hypothetical protein